MRGSVALVLAAAGMGASSIAAKVAFRHGADPGTLVLARFLLAGTLLVLVLRAVPRVLGAFGARGTLAWALFAGALVAAGGFAEFGALQRLPAAVVIVVVVSTPAWSALFRWLVWRQPVGRRQAVAIVAVIAGVALIAGPPGGSFDALGLGLALVTALTTGLLLPTMERLSPRCPTHALLPLALAAAGGLALAADPGAVPRDPDAELVLALLAIAAAAVGWGLALGFAMRSVDAVAAATVLAAEPVFVGVLAYLALGETLVVRELLGCALTLGGVVLAAVEGDRSGASRSLDRTPAL